MDRDEQLKLRREHVALVFQSFALLPMLSAAENIGVPMRLSRADPAARERRVSALSSLVGLEEMGRKRPHELSGGAQQRVGIARALANNGQLLLADEPTGQLDSQTGVDLLDVHVAASVASAGQSVRPVRARLAPMPIMIRPPVPPTAWSRRGERASQARAVPATSAQVLSQNTVIATKTPPSSSICAGAWPACRWRMYAVLYDQGQLVIPDLQLGGEAVPPQRTP